jgi:hypothetical protein
MDPPKPPLQNPIAGTTIDTSPEVLHLSNYSNTAEEGGDDQDLLSLSTLDRIKRKVSLGKKSGHRKLNSLSLRSKSPQSLSGKYRRERRLCHAYV